MIENLSELQESYECVGLKYCSDIRVNNAVPAGMALQLHQDLLSVNRTMSEQMALAVIKGLENGRGAAAVMDMLAPVMVETATRLSGVAVRYDLIFRKELALQALEENYLYISQGLESTCERCAGSHGRLFSLAELREESLYPPLHPNCGCQLVALDRLGAALYTWSNGALLSHLQASLTGQGGGMFRLNYTLSGRGFGAYSLEPVSPGTSPAIMDGSGNPDWITGPHSWALKFGADAKAAWDAFCQAQAARMEEISGPVSFLDWLTYGMVGDYFRGNALRGQEALDSPSLYTVANWLLGGVPDLAAGTFHAEEPLSFEHWMNSLGLVTLLFGAYQTVQQAAAVRAPTRLPDPSRPHVKPEDRYEGNGRSEVSNGGRYTEAQIKIIVEELQGDGFKNNPLRQAYEKEVAELTNMKDELLKQGLLNEDIAKILNQTRRDLGIKYKEATP